MKLSCKIIQDLLLLYTDDACSQESRTAVEEHLAHCPACRRHMEALKLPEAMDPFFSGLRISASYAVVGAVISEWLGGFGGLGVYMTRVKKAFSFDKMFAVIFLISFISLLLMHGVEFLQKLCMPWKQNPAGK